jgi:hypothetical protein
MLYYMIKSDFLITCLGLFLIIIVALLIGNADNAEGFEFIGDLNTNMNNLNNNMNAINAHLNPYQLKQLTDLRKIINNHTYRNNRNQINIKHEEDKDFLLALNNFQMQLDLIPSTNNRTLKNLQRKNIKIVNKINDIVMDNINNSNLPLELRILLGKIWWHCKKIRKLISDRTLAKDFKNSYKSVTYYVTPKAFIIESSDIGNTKKTHTREQYLSFINILREKINLVYQTDKKAMSESDKLILERDLANLESYMNTGKFLK